MLDKNKKDIEREVSALNKGLVNACVVLMGYQARLLREEKILATLRTKTGHSGTIEETAKKLYNSLVPDV